MAKKETTAKEIARMSYETRRRMFDQEQQKLFENSAGMNTAEVAEAHKKLVDKWRV